MAFLCVILERSEESRSLFSLAFSSNRRSHQHSFVAQRGAPVSCIIQPKSFFVSFRVEPLPCVILERSLRSEESRILVSAVGLSFIHSPAWSEDSRFLSLHFG